MILYITSDRVGVATGGGAVTGNESQALRDAFPGEPVMVVTVDHSRQWPDPFQQDYNILEQVQELVISTATVPQLAHCYAGCLNETVQYLQSLGTKVTYTVDAHDEQVSRQEHERLQVPFPYPHLVDPDLFKKYIGGYLRADHVVVPGSAPLATVRRQGRDGPVSVIPHGHVPPDPSKLRPPPQRFTVGYMGAYGPDKGVTYLLNAWRLLGYRDATLVLAGRDSTSPWVRHMVSVHGAGNIQMLGYVADVTDFYNQISLYVQPSATEGFGIEVVEAMGHGRIPLCSDAAGGADVVPSELCRFGARDASKLANSIDQLRGLIDGTHPLGSHYLALAGSSHRASENLTWDKVRDRYVAFWRGLMR